MPSRIIYILAAAVLATTLAAPAARAQQTTLELTQVRSDHSPRGALWRAAVAPGWGQLYNGQYFKAPIVWGGIVGLAGSALYVNHRYLLYRHAYHWIAPNVTYDVPARYEDDYLELIAELGLTPAEAEERRGTLTDLFQRNRDYLRRNRDLLYIGVGLFYGLTILDAYVSAHLLDFDVSDDLSLSVRPFPGGLAAAVRIHP